MIYFRKSRQSGIAVSKPELTIILSDRCNYSSIRLRPDLTSVMENSRGARADQFSSSWQAFSCVTVSLCDQTLVAKCSAGTYSTSGTLGLPAFNDMTNSIWICAWCLMQTGDGAVAEARAAADSEWLALLSYQKNRVSFCHGLEFAGNLFLSFSF